jgi:hypothetical protein
MDYRKPKANAKKAKVKAAIASASFGGIYFI